ncbi:MAG: hypothetical protein K2G45_09005 [Lachnospiraceae bacterium]|nr:hypothetical protein [Lachnospiraceae bacterium]
MKKKIIIVLTTIMIVVAVWSVVSYRQNKRHVDSGKINEPSDGEYRTKVIYEIDGPYNSKAGGGMNVYEGYTNNVHLDVKLEQGVVLVLFYDWNDPEAEPDTLEGNPDKYLFRTERITESGSYDYNMDDLTAGHYWVIINEEKTDDRDKMTVAEVDICFSNYRKNKGD